MDDVTDLVSAAGYGDDFMVGRLLGKHRADRRDFVNQLNSAGCSALEQVILQGTSTPDLAATARLLVAAGADVEGPVGRTGMTPSELAGEAKMVDVMVLINRLREATPPSDPNAALHAAAATGDANEAVIALRHGADIAHRAENHQQALLTAVYADHLEVARLLLALGADPNADGGCKDTPWLVTGVTGSVPMALQILPYGPDLKKRNRYGGVSIIPASERGHVDYVRFAADAGVNVNHVNDLHWTALLEAVILGDGSQPYVDIVRILLEHGANPDIADKDGVTALQHAKKKGQTEVVKMLQGGKH